MGISFARRQRFARPATAATTGVFAFAGVFLDRLWRVGTALVGSMGAALAAGHGRQAGRRKNHPLADATAVRTGAGLVAIGHGPQLGEVPAVSAVIFVNRHLQIPRTR